MINIISAFQENSMKLNEFNMKPSTVAKKALKEHFNTTVNFDSLSLYDTNRMLRKIKGLMKVYQDELKCKETVDFIFN